MIYLLLSFAKIFFHSLFLEIFFLQLSDSQILLLN